MPGHNFFELINNDGVRSIAGKVIQVVRIGATAPTAANVDMQGYARGAIMINATGTTTSNTIYYNSATADAATATWTGIKLDAT
jgi:hypothetical protein